MVLIFKLLILTAHLFLGDAIGICNKLMGFNEPRVAPKGRKRVAV